MATQFNNLYLASGGTLALAFGTSATKVYGSVDADTVTIAAGVTVVLDGSFNRGNDTIKFSGNAASYTIVKVNASTVRVTDADGTSVTIPVGSAGTKIEFADATRTLSGSSAGIILGNQSVTATPLALTAGAAPAPVESYTLSVNAASVTEGDTGSKTLSYKLTLDKAPTSSVTVNYETLETGTATANDDFVPVAGTVTFAAGQTVAFVSVTVLGDTNVEAPETIKLNLSGSKLVASVEATGTVVDNETAPVDPTSYTVTSGQIATADAQQVPISVNVGDTGSKTVTIQSDANGADRGVIINGNANISVTAGAAGDAISVSGNGNNTIDAGAGSGNDSVSIFGSGTNTIFVGAGDDTVVGGSGNDTIVVAAGALGAGDSFDGGAGEDTVRISGDGNVADYGVGGNLVNIERLVLDGTSVTITEANLEAAIAGGLLSITGSSSSSVITVTALGGTTIDLTGLTLSGVKELKVDAAGANTATLVLSAAQIAAIGAVTELAGDTLTINTTVAGYQALGAKAAGVTVTISDTVQNLIAAGNTISGVSATLGTATVAEAQSALASGLSVSYALVDTAANLALASVAVFTSATNVSVSDNATAAQATAIQASIAAANVITANADDITAAALTLNVRDSASNVSNYLDDAIDADTVAAAGNQALTVAQATTLAALNANATFQIVDTPANLANAAVGTLNRASAISATGALTVAQVNAINASTTDISSGYSLTDSAATLTTGANAAIVAAAGNVTVNDASISVATALTVEALANTGTTSYVLADNLTNLLAASSQVTASATAVSETANAALTAVQINSLVNKFGTAKLTDANLTVADTFANLLTLSAGSVAEATAAVTVTGGVGTVADAVALKALTGTKMPATFTVADGFVAVSGGLATASTLSLLDTANVTINVTGNVSVANVASLNAALLAGAGAKTAINGYNLSDGAAALALVANNAIVQAAATVAVTGNATVAQITTINGLATVDPTGFSLVDTAANLIGAGGAAAIDAAAVVTVSGAASVNDIGTIAGSFTVTGADAVLGTDIVYAIQDFPAFFNDPNAAGLALLNAATTATMVGDVSEVFAVGLTTAERDVADVIIVNDTLANLGTLTAGQLAEVDRLTIANINLDMTNATALAVNALAAQKPTSYSVIDAYADLTAATPTAAQVTYLANATSVIVDDNTANPALQSLTVTQFNALDALTAGTIQSAVQGTVAQLAAANAATAVASGIAAGVNGGVTVTDTAASIDQAATLASRLGLAHAGVQALVVTGTAAAIQAAASTLVQAVNSLVVSDNGLITGSVALVSKVYAANATTGSSYANYAIVDTAANVAAAGAAHAMSFAQSVTVTDTATQAQADVLGARTAMGPVTYSISDTAANIVAGAAAGRNGATNITVTGAAATLAQALTINGATNTGATTYAVSDTVANLALVNNAGNAASIAAIEAATGTVTATGNATGAEASLLAAFAKAVVFSVSDTPTALAASTGLGEAVNIVSTGATATTVQAATIMAAVNTGTTTISAVSGTAAQVLALTLGSNDTITTLSVTGTTTITDAVAINAKDTGANIGAVEFATVTGSAADILANLTVAGLATTVTVTGTVTVAQAALLSAADIADVTTAYTYSVADSFANIMADTTPGGAVDNAAAFAGRNVTATDVALTLDQATDLRTTGAARYTYSVRDNDATLTAAINGSDAALAGASSVTSANGTVLTLQTIGGQLAIVGTRAALSNLSTVLQGAEKVYEVSVADLAASPDTYVGLNGTEAFRVTDSIANLTSGNALLPRAISLVASDAATVAQATALAGLGVASTVYSLTDNAANIVAASGVNSVVDRAVNLVVTGTATFAQAATIEGEANTGTLTMNISDVAASVAGSTALARNAATNITVTGSLSAADAGTLLASTNSGSTTIANVTGSSADLAALTLTTNDTITTLTPNTAATFEQLSAMQARSASVTAYSLTDTAAELAKATTAQLNGATNISAVTAVNVALAAALDAATNTGTTNYPIADTAANILAAPAALLASDNNDIVVITDATVTAAVATQLRALDAANDGATGFEIVQGGAAGVFVISDTVANLTATVNAAAVAASTDVRVPGTITVADANLVRTAAAADAAPTYNLADTYSRLVAALATTQGATDVTVTNQVTVAQANSAVLNFAAASLTMNVRDTASSVAAGLAAGSAGVTAATQVSVSTSASVAQAARLSELPSSKLVGGYAISDTSANVVSALNTANGTNASDRATVLGASTVTLTDAATVAQALGVRGTEARGLYTIPGISYAITDSATNIVAGLSGSDAAGIENATSLRLADATGISVSNASTLSALANFDGYDGNGAYAIADAFAVVQAADTALVLGAAVVTANGTNGVGGDTIDMTGIGRAVSVNGLAGADTVFGTEFADTITGGTGADNLSGGNGRDAFVIVGGDSATGTGNFDRITDFTVVSASWTGSTANDTVAEFQALTIGGSGADILDLSATGLTIEADKASSVSTTALSLALDVKTALAAAGDITVSVTNGIMSISSTTATDIDTLAEMVTAANTIAATQGETIGFQFGGNTYVFTENGVGATADILVELTAVTGVAGLSLIDALDPQLGSGFVVIG
jgi:hypothetical protein